MKQYVVDAFLDKVFGGNPPVFVLWIIAFQMI